jgi:transaldolase
MPEDTLKAFGDHGQIAPDLPIESTDDDKVMAEFREAGIDLDQLAATLQKEAAEAFVESWNELLGVVANKVTALKKAS